MKRFNDGNKQFIIVIIFIAFISISICILAFSDSKIKSDDKKTSNEKLKSSNNIVSNSNVEAINSTNSNIKGSKPVRIVTSNKVKTSNHVSNNNKDSVIAYFTIDVSTNKIYVGNQANIRVNISPKTASSKVTYVSENPYVAQVSSNGVITGISPGVCNIKVNVEGGGMSSFQIQVLNNPNIQSSKNSNSVTTIIGSIHSNTGNIKSNIISNKPSNTTSYTLLSASFYANGASISSSTKSCQMKIGTGVCTLTTPTITRPGYEVIGWSTNRNATTANIKSGGQATIGNNKTVYYAITKKKVTTKFILNSGKIISRVCDMYNTNKSCSIVVPTYDDQAGKYGNTWSRSKGGYTNAVGNTKLSVSVNNNYYAVYRHPWRTDSKAVTNSRKDRNLSVQTTYTKGSTKFVYEKGIPTSAITAHKKLLDTLYSKMPVLFSPGKVFIMTGSTYSKLSTAYGLTTYWGPFFYIDLQYDAANKIISPGATVHELGHAWDGRFEFLHSSKKRIVAQSDMVSFYKRSKSGLSDVEWFAATVHDYYFRVLNYDKRETTPSGYDNYSSSQKAEIKNLMNKYIKIAKNGYK